MNSTHSRRVALVPLIILTSLGALHCSSDPNDGGSGGVTSKAGSPPIGGSSGAGASAGSTGGGGTATGGSSAAGMAGGGTATVGGGGASAGGGQGGTAGSSGGAAGAGGQAGGAGGGSAGAGGGGAFAITSSKLAEGAKFAIEFTCGSATSHSLPLSWTAGPSGTLSYALVMLDTNITFNHWVVYDIPPATLMLPEALATDATLAMPAGAKQKSGQGMGYLGPCPSGMNHTYKFTIYALDVATLPGVTANSSTMELSAAIQMHDIASASLSGTSDATKP